MVKHLLDPSKNLQYFHGQGNLGIQIVKSKSFLIIAHAYLYVVQVFVEALSSQESCLYNKIGIKAKIS